MPATFYGARAKSCRPAVLRFDGKVEEVEVEELTSDGCVIRSENKFEPFSPVSIGMAGIGHIPAHLVWFSGDTYGCSFDEPLPAAATVDAVTHNIAYLPKVIAPRPREGGHRQTPRR